MTKQVLDRLMKTQDTIYNYIMILKGDYERARGSKDANEAWRTEVSRKASGYLDALRDTATISEQERKALYCFITL